MSDDAWSDGTDVAWDKADTPYQDWWLKKEKQEGFVEFFALNSQKQNLSRERLRLFLPEEMVNQNPDIPDAWNIEQVRDKLLHIKPPPKDTVIVGIVDAGIAIGHRRLRMDDGSTRFLASWQQSATFDPQSALAYGHELFEPDINQLLEKHSSGELSGNLDEEAFNRDAALVEPSKLKGQRELDYRAAHGAHVLDLAAGFDPQKTAPEDLSKCRIIAVNLPPRIVHGSAGNFLTMFAINAVERILFLADALWAVHYPEDRKRGFSVVINFSFGLLAGPKDGSSPWEQEIRALLEERDQKRGIPTRLVMPSGNDNLSRANARKLVGMEGEARTRGGATYQVDPELNVDWRIHPSDHTSNFLEIWTRARERKTGEQAEEASPDKFMICVTPPGAKEQLVVPRLIPGQYSHLSDCARVYCYKPHGQKRAHFVICVAPTLSFDDKRAEAPAGLWKIGLTYPHPEVEGNKEIVFEVTFTVQSDQSYHPHTLIGRQSYLDHDDYQVHDEKGHLLDSYGPEEDSRHLDPNMEPWNVNGPVQRKGTHNALATFDEVIVVGGYRISDGKPAIYSSTFDGNSKRIGGRETPSALFPTDDGTAHFGLLASGAKEGSVVALRGTSMASALATRAIAMEIARTPLDQRTGSFADNNWLKVCADDFRRRNTSLLRYNALKQGAGPVQSSVSDRVPRFGNK